MRLIESCEDPATIYLDIPGWGRLIFRNGLLIGDYDPLLEEALD